MLASLPVLSVIHRFLKLYSILAGGRLSGEVQGMTATRPTHDTTSEGGLTVNLLISGKNNNKQRM